MRLKEEALADLEKTSSLAVLESLKNKYFGRKSGILTKLFEELPKLSLEEKREVGGVLNRLRGELMILWDQKFELLQAEELDREAHFDLTLPGKKVERGHLHILSQVNKKIREIFLGLNFSTVLGPEVETEYYNFDALNIPPNHPARDMWDTLWLQTEPKKLLRTHTSPVQVHYMKEHEPPFAIIVPGRVFRFEATDATHEVNFHQFEGLMIGADVNLANFKFVIQQFFDKFFNKKVKMRIRPSFFPFTEPSVEIDIQLPGTEKWLEVMGAGMVHPHVLEEVGYNPNKVQGFAFGGGLERLAMIKYNIPDIRYFYSGDLRFIKQF